MKTAPFVAAAVLAIALTTASTAHADGKLYVGGKLGVLDAGPGAGECPGCNFDRAVNAGVYGGYSLFGRDAHWDASFGGGTLAIEGEVTLTAIEGDTQFLGNWNMTSAAAYAAYRYPLAGEFYLKGKIGTVRYDVDTSVSTPNPMIAAGLGSHTAVGGGLGAGWKADPVCFEVEVTTYEDEVWFVTVGVHLDF